MARTLVRSIDFNKPPKNYMINGNFDFWQRATSFTGSALNFDYTTDRFQYQESIVGGGAATLSQSTDVPNSTESKYSCNIEATTAYTLGDGNDLSRIRHIMEGQFVKELEGKKAILSFWVKASKVGSLTASIFTFENGGGSWTNLYQKSFTIDQANTWERKIILIDNIPSGVADDNGRGIEVNISLVTGSNFKETSPEDTWISAGSETASSSPLGRSTDTDYLTNPGEYVRFSQFSFTDAFYGDIPFQRASDNLEQELQLCKRYYEEIDYPANTATGITFNAASATSLQGGLYYSEKRATPNSIVQRNNFGSFRGRGATLFQNAAGDIVPFTSTMARWNISLGSGAVANETYMGFAPIGIQLTVLIDAEL
jgi:hypothetical protein